MGKHHAQLLGLALVGAALSACGSTSSPQAIQSTSSAPTVTRTQTVTVPPQTVTPGPTSTSAQPGPGTPMTSLPPEQGTPVPPPPHAAPPKPPKPAPKTIALTFDDGPGEFTPQVLHILKEKKVPATFFVLGQQVDAPEGKYSKEAVDMGMSVQSHTYKHINMPNYSNEALAADLAKTNAAIKQVTGKAPTCVRPPYGARNQRTDAASKKQGLDVQIWDIDTEDWRRPGTKTIINRALATAHPGGVILMHDGGGDRHQTVSALPIIIDRLKAQGYQFVTLCS